MDTVEVGKDSVAKPVKIAISIPNESFTPVESYDNRLLWAFHLGSLQAKNPDKYEFYWYTTGRLFTPMARERLAQEALKANVDYIFMIDNDMIVYDIDIVERLLKHNVDIVAPLAFTRNPPHYPVIYSSIEGWDSIDKADYFQNVYVKNYPKNKLVECDAVGFGAVLINMNVLKKMKQPYFMSTSPTGEDIWFCYKSKKEANARVFCDTSIKLGHLGSVNIVTEETYESMNKIKELREMYPEYKKYETSPV